MLHSDHEPRRAVQQATVPAQPTGCTSAGVEPIRQLALAMRGVGEEEREERRKERKEKEERKIKKEKVNSIVMQGYSRQTGAMFVNDIRTQISLSGLRMGDPDVESVLMQHIYAKLPSDLQIGCGATTVEGMLKFLESISERYKSTKEITIAL